MQPELLMIIWNRRSGLAHDAEVWHRLGAVPTQVAWPGAVISAAVIGVILSAPVICGQAHQGAPRATARPAITAIICPPPSGDVVVAMSKSGDLGC
jgi:hypothetical protein